MVKAAVLRIVISRLLEAKRQQIGGNSELLNAPIPEAADLDTLMRYSDALKDREEYLIEKPQNAELELRRQEIASRLSPVVLEMFSEDERSTLSSPVPSTSRKNYRRQVEKLLEQAVNRQAIANMKAETLEEKRQQFKAEAGDSLGEFSESDLMLMLTPVTSASTEADRVRLSELMSKGEQTHQRRLQTEGIISEIEEVLEQLREQFPAGVLFAKPNSILDILFSSGAQKTVSQKIKRDGGDQLSAAKRILELLSEGGKLQQELELIHTAHQGNLARLEELRDDILQEFPDWHTTDPHSGLAVDVLSNGVRPVLRALIMQRKSPGQAFELLIQKLEAKQEFFRNNPWVGEKLAEASQPFLQVPNSEGRVRRDPRKRAQQIARSQAGPKKGHNPAAIKHGRRG
jgi:hypothetical protein